MMTQTPEEKQKVYALLADGSIAVHYWGNNPIEQNMLKQGNIFETEEEAINEKQRRLMSTMAAELKTKVRDPFIQIKTGEKTDFLIVDDRYIIDFKDILKVCEEFQRCQKA